MNSRILAIDFGQKRIGIAVSDALNITAQGIGVIEPKNDAELFRKIKEFIKEYGISKVIIGLPLNMDGTKGNSAKLAEGFRDRLKKETAVDIEMIDERLTTKQGERALLEADLSRKKRKECLDKIAAQLLLQGYLETKRSPNDDVVA